MKRKLMMLISLLTMTATLATGIPMNVSAESFDHSIEANIAGFDTQTSATGIFIYPNEGDSVRVIKADEYNFKNSRLLVFDADGLLIEAGRDIYPNTSTVTGSPQLSVSIPAGGFLVAFNASASADLNACFNTAMEGAMLYNATMAVTYEVHGSYDKGTNKLKVEYNDPEEPSKDAVKYLFVGNSSTYFNGTPIKYKAVCKAAGEEITVEYCTYGSANLGEFANENHERGKALRNKLKNNKYDYVVFQNMNGSTYEESKAALDIIIPLVKENGAEPLLYMRYCSLKDPSLRKDGAHTHNTIYNQLGEDFGLTVAPVADAFVICTEKYPDINLYADDNGHHSAAGSYLIACTWYMAYTGKSPVGNGYDANLDEETVKAIQDCAEIACKYGYDYEGTGDGYPNIPEESEEIEKNTSDASENVSSAEDENSGNVILWAILIIVIVAVAAGVAVYLIKSKK